MGGGITTSAVSTGYLTTILCLMHYIFVLSSVSVVADEDSKLSGGLMLSQ